MHRSTAYHRMAAATQGNGHTMMAERNNEQIADLIEGWIRGHVRGARGH
jgi:hypothetical protein